MTFKIVAIDGPTGVGKSTISRQLADRVEMLYLDTGAMFRCIAWRWEKYHFSEEKDVLSEMVNSIELQMLKDGKIICNEEDLTDVIRLEKISKRASKVSQLAVVRECVQQLQYRIVEQETQSGDYQGAVLEGRDIGTVIFPKADHKFFLTADSRIRAQRRFEQLQKKHSDVKFEDVLKALEERDQQDASRDIAPLKPADDAVIIDSSHMNIEEVIQFMASHINLKNS